MWANADPVERDQELWNLKRFLKRVGIFIGIVRSLRHICSNQRPRALMEFWEEIYQDPSVQAKDEYMSWIGQRLGLHASILNEIDREHFTPMQVIHPRAPPPHHARSMTKLCNLGHQSPNVEMLSGTAKILM
jgi:hypothetical protein